MTNSQLWQAVLGELELILSKPNFVTWFKQTSISEVLKDKVLISVPNGFTKSWLEKKYHKAILKALQNVTDNKIGRIEYYIDPQGESRKTSARNIDSVRPQAVDDLYPNEASSTDTEIFLNPRYFFSNFIVGSENELAHAASLAVAKEPGEKYNPLFIYGGVGLGKTHLLQAIGNKIKKESPELKITYASFEKFTNDYVEATKAGQFSKFRKAYRNMDILLIDDVQFMINKKRTQEEFFHTFETLHQKNKQIVVTSDRPPKALVELEERLISRFQWGMIAEINLPDFETRFAILKSKCQEKSFDLSQEILEYLASQIQTNIRELEGALNKIIAWYQLNQQEVTLESVKQMLFSLLINPARTALTAEKIIDEVSKFYGIEQKNILGASRQKNLVLPRQIIMYLMRAEMKSSYPNIGQTLGGRDHTTIIYAYSKITDILEEDERLQQEIEAIRQRLYR